MGGQGREVSLTLVRKTRSQDGQCHDFFLGSDVYDGAMCCKLATSQHISNACARVIKSAWQSTGRNVNVYYPFLHLSALQFCVACEQCLPHCSRAWWVTASLAFP